MGLRNLRFTTAILICAVFAINAWTQLAYRLPDSDFPGKVPVLIDGPVRGSDFVRHEEMIPMRDGVKLFTIILIPRTEKAMPILLTRTPYGASRRSSSKSLNFKKALAYGDDYIADEKYIRVYQDVRGIHNSEGDYVLIRPLHGPLNPTSVDHSTDTYDTIEWLLKNVPENNGRVGMIGTSYDGFLVLMGIVNPHPALKAAVPVNPMVDTWMGDDWFHNGAFRQTMVDYISDHEAFRGLTTKYQKGSGDYYDQFLQAGSAGEFARRMGMESLNFWRQLVKHPTYDDFWQNQAVDKILADRPLNVPTLYVHSLWDQEDIYGAIAAYRATEPKDRSNDKNFLVIGPWSHGGSNGNGRFLGQFEFNEDPSLYFRRNVLLPFLNEHLKIDAPEANTPPVLVYQTGINAWDRYDFWPLSCESTCARKLQPLYLRSGLKLEFKKPETEDKAFEEYVSDPATPVPYRIRPILPTYANGSSWWRWLVDDQRSFADRPDVISFQSDVLTHSIAISGQPIANLFASTSGTDSDFVVKLIDVYPDEYPSQPELAGYQLMISADILRGRYRHDWEHPTPVTSGKVEHYRWVLPAAAHVFLPGHRIMVQIQSSWFPLYDRNPQTYVENIFRAGPEDYKAATQRIYHREGQASSIELPLVHDLRP
jgi:putative CocE/NonD family hydrolase